MISSVKREAYHQAEAAIGQFYDGTVSAEELADTYQRLSDRLMDACKDRGYPMPLWGGMMGPPSRRPFTANSAAWSWTGPRTGTTPRESSISPGK